MLSTDSVDGQLWRFPDPINLVAVAESLAAPKIGAVLQFRGKWQKCPYLAPIFTIIRGKIGAPL